MSVDPSQSATPPASAGSDSAEEPELPPGSAPPTRPIQPRQDDWPPPPPPRPSFTPAAPTFTPAEPAAQAAEAEQPGQQPGWGDQPAQQPGWGDQPAQQAPQGFQPGGWPDQPGQPGQPAGVGQAPPPGDWPPQQYPPQQYPSQPGWPPQPGPGAMPGGQLPQGRRGQAGYPDGRPRRRHRGRRWVMALFTLIVVLILLVIGDRVANAVAENEMADQFVKNGFPVKPSVDITGFPFLTQLIAHDLRQVDISASEVPAGPVNITSIKATVTGLHINSSFNGGTASHVSGTAFVSFADLADGFGAGTGTGITLSQDGPDQVKITAGIGPLSDTEVATVTQTGPSTISVQVVNSGSLLGGLLSSLGPFSFSIPKLPEGLQITHLAVTPQGLTVSVAANNVPLTQPSSS
ncbi:DUF2993 domain-containing protein [Trebonia sp.]|uniref:LmeA family phospholipid-binding protein n=1 Tax=Trebonia sp. TaxID=2767075 RepID=UPI00263761AC|nr:DUF2993 domain-containing protein [Trebonia sp.]